MASASTCSLDDHRRSNEPDSSNYDIADALDNIPIIDEMATRQQQFNEGPFFVDKEGVAHCSGDQAYAEEFEER
eukprot:389779-Pyramimonas_sp.AAC.1